MLVKTAVLIVSNPNRLNKILPQIKTQVEKTLYIQVINAIREPFGGFCTNFVSSWTKFSPTLTTIYTQAALHCQNLDVRVLLSGLKYKNLNIVTEGVVDLVIFDEKYNSDEIKTFLSSAISNISKDYKIITYDNIEAEPPYKETQSVDVKIYQHAALGGTFDRLHIAHKLLLSEAALRSNGKITVGVTEENMVKSKILWELIEPLELRIKAVQNFLKDICPELNISVEPIADSFGPTQHDSTIDLLVVSTETLKGGQKVNEVRESKGLPLLDILPIDLIDDPCKNPFEEPKISSNSLRMRLLGTLLKPVKSKPYLPKKPYIIGLTGGIASGKSSIAQKLFEFDAQVIDCDKVGHEIYKKGKPCYFSLIKEFGENIVGKDGDIDRKVLGSIVFSNPVQLDNLNSLVWPALAEEVNKTIRNSSKEVVIVDAAILVKAGWEKYCHEVWASIIPPDEAVRRIMERNKLSQEQAKQRIDAQPSNKEYVDAANVLFCSLWPKEYTRSQVDRAWKLLMKRLSVL